VEAETTLSPFQYRSIPKIKKMFAFNLLPEFICRELIPIYSAVNMFFSFKQIYFPDACVAPVDLKNN